MSCWIYRVGISHFCSVLVESAFLSFVHGYIQLSAGSEYRQKVGIHRVVLRHKLMFMEQINCTSVIMYLFLQDGPLE